MQSFGKKLRECREASNLSQSQLAKTLSTNHSIIGKYERDEVKPTIDVVKRLADALDTNVGYLLGETQNLNVLKDSAMLKRLNDIASFSTEDQEHILFALDAMITKVKLKTL
ncbi:transcriptional regulator [Flavobacteriaceae bacterium (ex Bugula neritina AB1)]|nr:transcriptional regulator [Flavobacteriaceae bacterium (ex Bugula neritina AB1)]